MRAAVVVFPGSNCERDVAVSLEQVTNRPADMVWHGEAALPETDLIVVPGGFSYGDYLRAGAMAAKSPIMRDVVKKAGEGVPILGICNGFQVIVEAGLLPGALMRNAGLKYVCRDVHLRVERTDTIYSSHYGNGGVITIPVGHHDGNYFADAETLDRLEDENLVAFRYVTPDGDVTEDANPNGSQRNIAGIYDPTGRILGMMPHPERLADPALGGTDGRPLFESLLEAA
ncbi:MAG: phosphoribosylformylglycinamidine synthase subunit PurQ [Pseudomonadota bacterium]